MVVFCSVPRKMDATSPLRLSAATLHSGQRLMHHNQLCQTVHEEGGNIRPVCPPAATYLRVPCIPFLPERIQRLQRAFFRGCAVNLFQVTGYRFIVFPRHEPQAVAYHVYYAQLDLRLRVETVCFFELAEICPLLSDAN